MNALYVAGFWILKCIVFILPNRLAEGFFKLLARIYFKISKQRRENLLVNLNLAFKDELSAKEKLEIARKCYENFAIYLGLNFIKNQNTTKEEVLKRVEFKNAHYLQDAISSGRGVIVATAHLGEWELFSLAMAAKFKAVSVIGRRLDSKPMQAILAKNRQQFDIEVIEKSGAAKGVLSALKKGRLVGILVDQNTAKNEGLKVEFFNRPALHTPAASTLALKAGALIIPAYINKYKDKNQITFYPPIDPSALSQELGKQEAIQKATQLQASTCESAVRLAVDEYFWFHKRFKHFNENDYK